GIGNYLKSEILYLSGLSPYRKMNTLTIDELEKLRICSHKIILNSYHAGGLTIKDFISPNGEFGNYQPMVYDLKYDAFGNDITKVSIGGRCTYWVPNLQN